MSLPKVVVSGGCRFNAEENEPIIVADNALVFSVCLASPGRPKEITAYSSEIDTSVEKCLRNDRGAQKCLLFS